jgi:hypothetical protein
MAKSKKAAVKKPKSQTSKSNHLCFVIMPFGGWFDKYYEEIFCPAIKNSGLVPKRADDLYRPSNIVQDIWAFTKKAKIILADLTNKNPNVFYELGLAHAATKPVILITQNIEDIPFDLRSLRIIEYDKNSPNWGTILQEDIKNAITETLESPNETIPSAFLEVSAPAATKAVTKKEKDLVELKQKFELLERQVMKYVPTSRSFRPMNSADKHIDRIKGFLHDGMSEDLIIRRMMRFFRMPSSWTRQKIDLIKSGVI